MERFRWLKRYVIAAVFATNGDSQRAEARVYAHFLQKNHLISTTWKVGVCSSSSRTSVLAVLVVLPGFSKGGGRAKLEGLNRSLSAPAPSPIRRLLCHHCRGLSDVLVVLMSVAQEASVDIFIVETCI